jgi:hypothetical protein
MRILQNHTDLLATPRPSEKEEVERQKAREKVREIESEWTGLLERGMASGTFPTRDAHALARVALAMVVSVWRWYRPGGRVSLDEVSDLISATCLRAIGP